MVLIWGLGFSSSSQSVGRIHFPVVVGWTFSCLLSAGEHSQECPLGWLCVCVCACVCARACALSRFGSVLTLCYAMDCSSPGSPFHGILQARMLEWVAIFDSRGIFPTQGLNPSVLHFLNGQADSSLLSSVAQLSPALCYPLDCSTPGFLVLYQLPEFTQTHVHWVGDAIQSSHTLSSPSPPAFNLSQHQGLFQGVSSLHQVAKVLEFQFQHPSFQ